VLLVAAAGEPVSAGLVHVFATQDASVPLSSCLDRSSSLADGVTRTGLRLLYSSCALFWLFAGLQADTLVSRFHHDHRHLVPVSQTFRRSLVTATATPHTESGCGDRSKVILGLLLCGGTNPRDFTVRAMD
jgi:hypothetical protein